MCQFTAAADTPSADLASASASGAPETEVYLAKRRRAMIERRQKPRWA